MRVAVRRPRCDVLTAGLDTMVVSQGAQALRGVDESTRAAESALLEADIRDAPEAWPAARKCQTHGVVVAIQVPIREAQDAISDLRIQHPHRPGRRTVRIGSAAV